MSLRMAVGSSTDTELCKGPWLQAGVAGRSPHPLGSDSSVWPMALHAGHTLLRQVTPTVLPTTLDTLATG